MTQGREAITFFLLPTVELNGRCKDVDVGVNVGKYVAEYSKNIPHFSGVLLVWKTQK